MKTKMWIIYIGLIFLSLVSCSVTKHLPEDEVLHHRGRVAPLDDIVRVGVGDGAQADGLALQHR